MLLQVREIGTDHTPRDGDRRLYYVQTPDGANAVLALCDARAPYGQDDRIEIRLEGTEYTREYPAAGKLDADRPPTIADLADGYSAIAAFVQTWQHATPEQRADLWLYDKPYQAGKSACFNCPAAYASGTSGALGSQRTGRAP